MTSLLTFPALAHLVSLSPDPTPVADDVTPGWIYPLVFFSLVALTILLWFSMRKQLKKIRFSEEPTDPGPERGPDDDLDRPAER